MEPLLAKMIALDEFRDQKDCDDDEVVNEDELSRQQVVEAVGWELTVYDRLKDLQGSVIPVLHGGFVGARPWHWKEDRPDVFVLMMEDVGEEIDPHSLSRTQR